MPLDAVEHDSARNLVARDLGAGRDDQADRLEEGVRTMALVLAPADGSDLPGRGLHGGEAATVPLSGFGFRFVRGVRREGCTAGCVCAAPNLVETAPPPKRATGRLRRQIPPMQTYFVSK